MQKYIKFISIIAAGKLNHSQKYRFDIYWVTYNLTKKCLNDAQTCLNMFVHIFFYRLYTDLHRKNDKLTFYLYLCFSFKIKEEK